MKFSGTMWLIINSQKKNKAIPSFYNILENITTSVKVWRKRKRSEISEFSILGIVQNWKLGNLRTFYFFSKWWSGRKLRKDENLENLRNFLLRFLNPSLSFGCRIKLKTQNNVSKMSEFSNFSEFWICQLCVFFLSSSLFIKMFFQDFYFTLVRTGLHFFYKYSLTISWTSYNFFCLCSDL